MFLKKAPLVCLAVVFLLVLGAIFFLANLSSETTFFAPASLEQPLPVIKITAVGDIMLDRGVEYMIGKYGNNDFTFPFQKTASYLNKADIAFGNLESVISDKGYKAGSIYSFEANPLAMEGLKFAGFDIVNLANNHAFDYTRLALEDTMERLAYAQIAYTGTGKDAEEAFGLRILEVKGVKIGFLGYTNLGPVSWRAGLENKSGAAWIERSSFPYLKENIAQAKKQCDILIVSLHAGNEYQTEPTSFQRDFAQLVVDAGADLVLMHHTHVVGPLEKINGKFVAFGLGNFIFDQAFSEATMEGGMLEVTIKGKEIAGAVLKKIRMNKFYQAEMLN